jgi:hypothetical protein
LRPTTQEKKEKKRKIPFKIMLLADTAPVSKKSDEIYDKINVFMPVNTIISEALNSRNKYELSNIIT